MHSSITNLLNYLKGAGLKRENVIIALTFFDGSKQDDIDKFIGEMKEHPLTGDLFTFASEIIITTLPELQTLEQDFVEVFEKRRDKIIEKYYSIFMTHVEPVAIMTHEKFIEEIEKQKTTERKAVTTESRKEVDEALKKTQEMEEKLIDRTAEYDKVNDELKNFKRAVGIENKEKVALLEHDKKRLTAEIKQLKDQGRKSCFPM